MYRTPVTAVTMLVLIATSLRAEVHDLAEPPHWPLAWQVPEHLPNQRPGAADEADVLVWIPPGVERIRALVVAPRNTDTKVFLEHPDLRDVAARHEVAIVYLSRFDTGLENEHEDPDPTRMVGMMEWLAVQTGMPEFVHAPWITFGKSSRGRFPFRMAWQWPERTIASISYHAETPSWPMREWSRLGSHSILHVNINGETEWGGTWFVHVRPSLLNYHRHTGMLGHMVVGKDVGHGDYAAYRPEQRTVSDKKMTRERIFAYLATFVDTALTLRLPETGYPSAGPLSLRSVERDSGYLIDPYAVEDLFRVPRFPLRERDGSFHVGNVETAEVNGYAEFSPPDNYQPGEGVSVEALVPGKSPTEWILTDSWKFAMGLDPMTDDLGGLNHFPEVGTAVTIEGREHRFAPIADHQRGHHNGGIRLSSGLKSKHENITLLAFTVVEVAERQQLRVEAGFTPATRVQLVLAGTPIHHRQILDLQPGRYPLLLVLRMSAHWGSIEPFFSTASPDLVAQAKEAARQAADDDGRPALDPTVIRFADTVDPDRPSSDWLWVPTRAMARAWFDLHAVHGQEFTLGEKE